MKFFRCHFTALLASAFLLVSLQGCGRQSRFVRPPRTVDQDLGSDHFAAGPNVDVNKPVAGDLLVAGGTVGLSGSVAGDAVASGGTLHINGTFARDLYAAGGQLFLNGRISGNARMAGGNVDLSPESRIDGNLTVAAGQARINGPIGGYLQSASGNVYIDAPVGGDVEAAGGTVELGPNARIAGKLFYRSPEDLKQDPGAQVAGGIERRPFRAEPSRAFLHGLGVAAFFIWLLGLILISIALLLLLPGFFPRVVQQLGRRAGISFLLGFAVFVCVPAAAVILLFTLVGIPLSLLAMAAYFVLWAVGYIVAATALGATILRLLHAGAVASFGSRFGAAVLGILILAILGRIPLLGGLIVLIALVMGIGAIVLQLHHELSPGTTP